MISTAPPGFPTWISLLRASELLAAQVFAFLDTRSTSFSVASTASLEDMLACF